MQLDSIGVLFSKSFERFKANAAVALQIYILPAVLIMIAQLLVATQTAPALALGSLINLFAIVVTIVATIALISCFGNGTGFADSYRVGFQLFWASVWIGLIKFLATMGGYVMFIIPGIILSVQLVFSSYVLVLEGRHGFAALAQSRAYVKGYWWAYVGRSVLLVLAFGAVALIVFLPAKLIFGNMVAAIVYAIMFLVFAMFGTAFLLELFENLRRLKPDLASAPTIANDNFLKVAAVLGVIGIVLGIVIFIGAIVFLVVAFVHGGMIQPGANGSFHFNFPSSTMMGSSTDWNPGALPSGTPPAAPLRY